MFLVPKLLKTTFMQLLNNGYKRLKVLIHILHSLNWFQNLWCVLYVFIITFYLKKSIYYIYSFYNPKFKKLSSGYDCFWYMLIWLYPCANPYSTHSSPRGMCPLKIETIFNYKLIDPPRGMYPSIHYPSTMKRYMPIRNWNNTKWPLTFYIVYNISSYLLFSFTISTSCI
jgi:hypothetical protein